MRKRTRRPTSPGEILHEEFLVPLGMTQEQLASALGITRRRVNEIVRGRRGITVDTAVRLARFFRLTPEFWLHLQHQLDCWNAEHESPQLYDSIVPYSPSPQE